MKPSRFVLQSLLPVTCGRMYLKALLLSATLALTALPVEAASFLIDFGTTASPTTGGSVTWNNFTELTSGARLLNLRDTSGISFDYDLTYTGTTTLSTVPDNNVGAVIADTPEPFNVQSVIIDSFFQSAPATFTLSSLDPLLTYSFTFYSHVSRVDSRLTNFSINGTTVSIEPGNTGVGGKGGTATISNVVPDAAGNIVFTVSSGRATNWIFNAAQITSVPEPSTALLALAGAATCCAVRRRKR